MSNQQKPEDIEMIAVFQIGDKEHHRVEVEQPMLGRQMAVKVDDKIAVTHSARYGQFSYTIPFSVGNAERHDVEIRFNYLTFKYEVYVDGKVFIGCLFPQAVGYNAFFMALLALLWAVFGFIVTILRVL